MSRVELAERSGLTGASISRTVKRLLDDGLLVEVGQGDSTGGKRPTLLELNTPGRYAVGISVDDARLTYVLINLRGQVVGDLVSAGSGRDIPSAVVERVAGDVRDLLDRYDIRSTRDVVGVGVATAGRIDVTGTALRSSRETTEWEQFSLSALPWRRRSDFPRPWSMTMSAPRSVSSGSGGYRSPVTWCASTPQPDSAGASCWTARSTAGPR